LLSLTYKNTAVTIYLVVDPVFLFIICTPVPDDRIAEIWNNVIETTDSFTRLNTENWTFGYDIADYDKQLADLQNAGVTRTMDFQIQSWSNPLESQQSPYGLLIFNRDKYYPLLQFSELPGSTMSYKERIEFCNFFMHHLHTAGVQSSLVRYNVKEQTYFLEPLDHLLAQVVTDKKNSFTKKVANASITMCISIPKPGKG